MELNELIKIVKDNGIIGAGGAGFPTYQKLSVEKNKINTLIINGAECEPLVNVDKSLLKNNPYEILKTVNEIGIILGVSNIIIGIKENDALTSLQSEINLFPAIKIKSLNDTYPSGDEFVLIYETTGQVINEGEIPLTKGIIVLNVETIFNIYNAMYLNLPVTQKYVTISGEVKNPKTILIPVGTSFKSIIEYCGGFLNGNENYTVIEGGVMTGIISNINNYIKKTTKSILVLKTSSNLIMGKKSSISKEIRHAMSVCSQCRMCTDLCPRALLGHSIKPHEFMQAAAYGMTSNTKAFLNTFFCSDCGVCELYACHQGLSPRRIIQDCKRRLIENKVKPPKNSIKKVDAMREYRKIDENRLISRLGLYNYKKANFSDNNMEINSVRIFLKQGIGVPALPIVKISDIVKKNDVIGIFQDKKLSTNIHASIDGTVTEVTDVFITIKK